MKLLLLFLPLFLHVNLSAQEFSFKIYFEDAVGERDTIEIGYDSLATDEIDPSFGEVDIQNKPLNPGLDVRIGDYYPNRRDGVAGRFKTKKQIMKTYYYYVPISFDVKTNNYPVTLRWNSELFDQPMFEESLISCSYPGGWWDVLYSYNMPYFLLWKADSCSIIQNYISEEGPNDTVFPSNCAFINEENDTVSIFYMAFDGNLNLSTQEQERNEKVLVYPNPVEQNLYIENRSFKEIEKTEIMNGIGDVIEMHTSVSLLNMEDYKTGLYYLKIYFEDRSSLMKKVIKY